MSKHNNQAPAVAIDGALITSIATSIAVSSDENASSHDSLWSEVKHLFEAEPKVNDDKGARETAARVWKVLESYLVEGHDVARKRYYEAKPKTYASQTLKYSGKGATAYFQSMPSHTKGLSFSDVGGFENYQQGKSYKLSFAECYDMSQSVYSSLKFNKEDGTDKHNFGAAGDSLRGFMQANRKLQLDYMTAKKSNVIKGWVRRFKLLCNVSAPTADPKLWEDDLKTDLESVRDSFVKAKKNSKHMSESKRDAWDAWFHACPVNLEKS